MQYTDLIKKKKQYKYSANLCLDLGDEDRLGGFIPNVTTTEIIKEYMLGIINGKPTNHSRILYGSYGTGKSHLLTVICSIIGHIATNSKGFKTFCNAIEKYDIDLADDIRKYTTEELPFLVVPVYSDFAEFDKCISYSLKKELEKNNISVCFKSYFDEAIGLLDIWSEGETSAERLEEECKKNEVNYLDLYDGLCQYDAEFEKEFNAIFRGMSYGANFVSATGNLIDNIEVANEAIKNTHKGIAFVFDEFGRYLEDFGENIKVKVIQDLAEYCDHSKYNDYLIMVSHKQLSMYTDKMQKDLSEEWKKIEGRFKSTSINVKYDQCLSLIPHIIPKTRAWTNFKKKYESQLTNLFNEAWDFKGFLLPPEREGESPFEGGYPLHPITLFSLDRLSKKVAQNERTFFTYLASDEENSLSEQLKLMDDDKFHFVGLDAIYDYFETNIRAYKSNEAYAIYKKLQFATNKLSNIDNSELPLKVLKAMAVIYIISNADLATDRNTLIHVIDADITSTEEALNMLEQKKIIKYMRQYGYYDFLDSSIYDFDAMIEEKMSGISDDMAVSTLNECFAEFVLYPYEYNSKYHMNRIFLPSFVQQQDLEKKSFINSLPENYDGILAFVLDEKVDMDDYKKCDTMPERMLLLVNADSSIIKREVKRYISIQYYYAKKEELAKDDPTVTKELELYLSEQREVVSEIIHKWKAVEGNNIFVVANGEKVNIESEMMLSKEASRILFEECKNTIIINNDLINKNNITGAIKQARNKALEYIFNNEDIFSDCALLSPEHTILRSVLSKNDIVSDTSVQKYNYLPDGKKSGEYVMKAINKFLKRSMQTQMPLQDIYKELKAVPFGLRDGYLPILFAYALRSHENVSLYFHGSERDFTSDNLIEALENAEDYSIYICNLDDIQRDYIYKLEEAFSAFLNKESESKNRLKDLFFAINTHFSSISKSARTTEKYVSDIAKQYRDILSISYKNYNKFFFEVLTQINNDYHELSVQISNIKEELESVNQKQVKGVERVVRKAFEIDVDDKLVSLVVGRYKKEWAEKRHIVFDYQTNAFLDYFDTMDMRETDIEFINDLAKIVTGFEIDYWSDSKIIDFEESLIKIINNLDDFELQEELSNNEIKIIVESGKNSPKVTQFNKTELTENSQMMFNKLKSTVDNFGQGITYEEKMQVIAKLLNEFM